MTSSNPRRYLETQVMTASREQLLLMLYDGALRFCEQGREAMAAKEAERVNDLLVRAQRIVIELWCALDPRVEPELAKSLGGLYSFLYLRLVHAKVHQDAAAVGEVIGLLTTLRQAWGEAVEQLRGESARAKAADASSIQVSG